MTVILPDGTSVQVVKVALQGPPGPQGDPGPQGPPGEAGPTSSRGNFQYIGHGDPGVIVGAQAGETYLDEDSGLIWTLY